MAEKKHFIDDFEEYEVTEDHHPSRAGFVMRVIFYTLILLINCALIFRVCMMEDPNSVKSPTINDTLREAYASADDFQIYTQTIFDMYTSDGIYYSTGMFLCPAAGELQVTVRYNVRTADDAVISTPENDLITSFLTERGYLAVSRYAGEVVRRYGVSNVTISSSDMRSKNYFAFRLADDRGNYYLPVDIEKTERLLYVYNKLTFDGLPADTDSNYYVEIYPLFGGVPDYDTRLGRMKVYSADRQLEKYNLSGKERSTLS